MARGEAPAAIIGTATNCEAPANTSSDMPSTSIGSQPGLHGQAAEDRAVDEHRRHEREARDDAVANPARCGRARLGPSAPRSVWVTTGWYPSGSTPKEIAWP